MDEFKSNGESFKKFLENYEQKINKDMNVLKKPKLITTDEQSEINREKFLSNLEKKMNQIDLERNEKIKKNNDHDNLR